MRRAPLARLRKLAPLLVTLATTFGIFASFELRIAQSSARADAASAQTIAAEDALRAPWRLEAVARAVNSRLSELHLTAGPSAQGIALLNELERVTAAHGIRLMSLREAPNEPIPPADPEPFRSQAYEIVLEGAYPPTLHALGDLSRERLVLRAQRLAFERLRDRQAGEVRTTIALEILRLSNPKGGRDDRPHAP